MKFWGENLKRLREERKLTQNALAAKAKIKQSNVSGIETGVIKDPRLSTLIALSDALEVSLDELCGRLHQKMDIQPREEQLSVGTPAIMRALDEIRAILDHQRGVPQRLKKTGND